MQQRDVRLGGPALDRRQLDRAARHRRAEVDATERLLGVKRHRDGRGGDGPVLGGGGLAHELHAHGLEVGRRLAEVVLGAALGRRDAPLDAHDLRRVLDRVAVLEARAGVVEHLARELERARAVEREGPAIEQRLLVVPVERAHVLRREERRGRGRRPRRQGGGGGGSAGSGDGGVGSLLLGGTRAIDGARRRRRRAAHDRRAPVLLWRRLEDGADRSVGEVLLARGGGGGGGGLGGHARAPLPNRGERALDARRRAWEGASSVVVLAHVGQTQRLTCGRRSGAECGDLLTQIERRRVLPREREKERERWNLLNPGRGLRLRGCCKLKSLDASDHCFGKCRPGESRACKTSARPCAGCLTRDGTLAEADI